jgi:hypothetical protein
MNPGGVRVEEKEKSGTFPKKNQIYRQQTGQNAQTQWGFTFSGRVADGCDFSSLRMRFMLEMNLRPSWPAAQCP